MWKTILGSWFNFLLANHTRIFGDLLFQRARLVPTMKMTRTFSRILVGKTQICVLYSHTVLQLEDCNIKGDNVISQKLLGTVKFE